MMDINFTLAQTAMGQAQRGLVKVAVFMFVLIQCGVAQQQERLSSSFERSALLNLRSSLGLRGKDWSKKSDPCTNWTGVQCQNGRVTGINVSGLRRTRIGRANPQFAVDSLANFTLLQSFNASGFSLPGSIPDWFGLRLNVLQVLDLRSCSIIGPIPSSLGNLRTLNSLYLSSNSLTGIISPALGQLSELLVLDLSRNTLTGSISSGFGSLGNLTKLDLSSNFLSGPIPPSLGNLSSLQYLNLSDNSLTSSIPGELGGLSRLVELNLSKNSLSGSLPVELRGLRSLRGMDFGQNVLEGPLPDGLFMNLSSNGNATVVLSHNRLYGALNLSSLGKYSLLDLSSNYFQGKILDASQSNVTVDRNCLQMVPEQRSLEDCRMFYAEEGLTFDNFGAPEGTQPPLPEPDSKTNRRLIYIMVGLFGGIGFIVLLVFVIVLLLRMCDKGTADQRGTSVGTVLAVESPLPKDPVCMTGVGEIYAYEQILHFTGDFSEANLIKHGHSGDLFRGFLEGLPVVIKKIDLYSFKKESFMMELEFFSKVSHIRLVPLLGHCLEHESEKFLVYKDLPNGDLANSLHRVTNSEDGSLQSLDWITRLKIATGAAEGLAYLHHECTPPLVHRDVQASSILLDDKYEVRLGSLSEVHAQEGEAHQNALTRFLRKPQISEQGPSGLSSATCAYDVYCFGKVLLELVTGKLGISKSDDATTRDWLEQTLPHISIYDKELVTKIVDPSLIVDEDLLEEVWAMAIVARSCLNPKPSRRPPMKYILKALENPLKIVREESSSSARLRTTSSRRSWSAAYFGSWRQSSSEGATIPGHSGVSGLKQSGRVNSHGSGGHEFSSSNKRLSSEIFPEPVEMQDLERQDEH